MTRRIGWVGFVFFPALLLFACSSTPEAKLAKHVKNGDEYVKEQKFREAVIEYKNAVKAVPKDAAAHWKLAQAALESKDIRTAFQELQETVKLDPSNLEALGKLGEIYVVAGKIPEASQVADNLVRARPDDPQGYILQSGIAVRTGKVDDAIANLRKANELWMALRAQVGGDQLNLLARGWVWGARGELVPYGNPLSSGGNGPAALTTVVVGAPLFVWMDHRAPVALTWLCHLAAFLLLDRILARHLSATERLAFAAVYWHNPWRIEASPFLWNPNLLFLAGAVHLTTAFGSRERASLPLSALHVLTLGLAFQLHPGTLLLAALSALLWLRGYARVRAPAGRSGSTSGPGSGWRT